MHEYHLGLKQHCFENAFQKKLHSFSFWYTLYFTLQDLSVGLINLHRWLLNNQMIKSILQSVQYKNMVWLCVCSVITMQARNLVHSEQTHLYCFFSRLFKNQLFTSVLKHTWMLLWGFVWFILHIPVHSLLRVTRCIHTARSVAGNHYSFQSGFSIRHTPVVTLRRLVGTMWHAGFGMILRAILTHSKWISYTPADTKPSVL